MYVTEERDRRYTLTRTRISAWFSAYSSVHYGARLAAWMDQPYCGAWPVKVRVVAHTFLDLKPPGDPHGERTGLDATGPWRALARGDPG